MKSAKLKIAAVAMAAISGVCSMQAITASAAFQYTQTSQEVKERQSTMDTYVARWKSGWWNNDYLPNTTWNKTVVSGPIIGAGYSSTVPGGYHENQSLTGSKSLVRALAQDYFDTTIFMSFFGGSKEFSPRIGDQVCLKKGSTTKYIFITKGPSGTQAIELVNGKITYNRAYGVGNGAMYYGNEYWSVQNYLRPVKEGDANGDSYVYLNSFHNISGDDATFRSYLNYGIPGTWNNAITAALTMNDDWNVTWDDYQTWHDNLYYNSANGCMRGNFGYLKRLY